MYPRPGIMRTELSGFAAMVYAVADHQIASPGLDTACT